MWLQPGLRRLLSILGPTLRLPAPTHLVEESPSHLRQCRRRNSRHDEKQLDNRMSRLGFALVVIAVAALQGCAQDAVRPEVLQTIDPALRSSLRISDITVETAWGITLMPDQLQHIAGNVKGAIEQTAPGMIVSPPGSAAKLRVV